MSDGATEGEHVAAARKHFEALGMKTAIPEVADRPEPPETLLYLFGHFSEIACGISSSGFGIAVVTWTDLAAWSELTGEFLDAWEYRAIVRLSVLRASVLGERLRKEQETRPTQ